MFAFINQNLTLHVQAHWLIMLPSRVTKHHHKPRGKHSSCCCEWTTQQLMRRPPALHLLHPTICPVAGHSAHSSSSSIRGCVLPPCFPDSLPSSAKAPHAALTFPTSRWRHIPSGDPLPFPTPHSHHVARPRKVTVSLTCNLSSCPCCCLSLRSRVCPLSSQKKQNKSQSKSTDMRKILRNCSSQKHANLL